MMLRPLLTKELYKTRLPLVATLAANVLLMCYLWLTTAELFRKDHAEMVWYRVMQLDAGFHDILRYAPLATGAVLALVQFVPEMKNERLRLSLHLPVGTAPLMATYLLAGLAALGVCLGIQAIGLAVIVSARFPVEVLHHALWQWAFWALAGAGAYLSGALVLVEPVFGRRMVWLALLASVMALPFWTHPHAAYAWLGIVLVLLVGVGVLHPTYRYRFRRVG